MVRIVSSLLALFLFFTGIIQPVSAQETTIELADKAASAILIERDTGTILYQKNSHEKLPPASMTKIMTMLLIMEALEEGKLKMSDMVRTSAYAASMGGSQIFLEEGEEMSVQDLLKGIAIASGNDASVAMAERIAGSTDEFVEMMNKKAKELGLQNTHFQNPTGLPASEHYSTAADMATMAKELLKYEHITGFTGKYEDYLRKGTDNEFWLVNTNRLVKFYPGVDGLKTGFTNEAKYCLTVTAKKNDMRVIAVVMGAPTPKERNQQISKMLDYAFMQFETHPMLKRYEQVATVEISKGEKKYMDVVTRENISLLTKKGEQIDKIKRTIDLPESVPSPVVKGQEIGTITYSKDGKVLQKSSLIAAEDVNKASWWQLFKRVLGSFSKKPTEE
ncbi:D-alanyl-D-alanine carboxypeptidase family protein [Bacillus solimangrovi]|uniref:serine-type D-Ala-D-Ala carboxypeptidase n=1 Tax=Bacillus solimangrovi TaxID=1305675 RepID=A0A1E5LHM5_9BACI|nr:D-alanyl-D-alanine carboxypeptidase family protein [Bacillus solimangrovi]OEH93592.1 D-alanyl-D-alanine carboxypeptidase [Bacillus solimangrovi]